MAESLNCLVVGRGTCPFCNFRIVNLSSLLSHLRYVHSNDPGFFVTCRVDGCTNTYVKYASFRTHVYRHHKDHLDCSAAQVTTINNVPEIPGSDHDPNIISQPASSRGDCSSPHLLDERFELVGNPVSTESASNSVQVHSDVKRKTTALFLLKMKETFGLSQRAIDGIVVESESLFEQFLENIQGRVLEAINRAGISPDTLPGLKEVFKLESQGPFHGLNTRYLQEQFFRQSLNLVVSWGIL